MRVLAFDIGGTVIKYGIVNEYGKILEKYSVPTNAKEGGEAVLNKIISIIPKFNNIDKIGISTAGQVNPECGSIIYATENIPGWTGIEIKRRIEEIFCINTNVENDVNAAALGESQFGAGKNYNSFLCLTYGTGIGGAIIENGRVYRGASYSAGEFGHIITHGMGNPCTCGKFGCYEVYASTTALIKNVESTLGIIGVDGIKIFEEVNNGNEAYVYIVNPWIDEIIYGLSSIIHIFNPSLIILGGGIMEQDYIIDYIKKEIKNYIMPSYQDVKITQALLGNDAGLLGASLL